MAGFSVVLACPEAASPEAAAQICDSLAHLSAAAEGVFAGVDARLAHDRGACVARSEYRTLVTHAETACSSVAAQRALRRCPRASRRRTSAWKRSRRCASGCVVQRQHASARTRLLLLTLVCRHVLQRQATRVLWLPRYPAPQAAADDALFAEQARCWRARAACNQR